MNRNRNRKWQLAFAGPLALLLLGAAGSASASASAKFAPSRISGVAPLAVFLDATGSTSTATTLPFHELTYTWDFGDPNSGTWTSFQGMPTRPKNTTFGPVAAHVFDKPGTYTVTLVVQDGAGGSSTAMATISVSDPNTVFSGTNTICIANSGQDFTGCPSGATQVVTSAWSTVRSNVTSGKRVLLRGGGTYTNSSTQTFSGGSVGILGAFGSGAKPKVISTTSAIPLVMSSSMTDWRIMDIAIDGSGQADAIVKAVSGQSNVLLYRVDTANSLSTGDGINFWPEYVATPPDGFFVVESTATGCGVYCYFGPGKRAALMGNDFGHAGQHVIRATAQDLMVISSNYLHDSGSQQHLIKFHGEGWDSGSAGKYLAGQYSGRAVIADNVLGEHSSSTYVAIGAQNNTEDERVKDVIVERNFCRVSSNAGCVRAESIQTTVRNNIFHLESNTGTGVEVNKQQNGIEGTNSPAEYIPRSIWIYNNTGYTTSACTDCNPYIFDNAKAQTSVAKNNLLFAPNSSVYPVTWNLGTGWTTSNNVKAASNPFVVSSPSTTQPLGFALQSTSPAATAGTALKSNLVDFKWSLRTGTTSISVGALESGATTSSSLQAPVLLSITPQ